MNNTNIKINHEYMDNLQNKVEYYHKLLINNPKKIDLDSPIFIKFIFSSMLLEDLEFLSTLEKKRYIDITLRNTLEQAIEFIYLIKYPEKINDYLGLNTEEISTNRCPEKEFHKLASKRYKKNRLSVSKMVNAINKISSVDCTILYGMYIILSEKSHNSYYFEILNDIGNFEFSIQDNSLLENNILDIIIQKFLYFL